MHIDTNLFTPCSIYVCMCVCLYGCICVWYISLLIFVIIRTNTSTHTIIHTYIHMYIHGNLRMCGTFHCTFSSVDSQRLMQIHHDRFGGFTQNAIALSYQGYRGLYCTSQYPIKSEKDDSKDLSSSGGQ